MPNYPNLKAEMARCGITQQEMAMRLDVKDATVSSWLNGNTDPKLSQLRDISQMLGGKSIEYLFWDEST